MKEVHIYQAIAKKGSPDEREKLGPIFCVDNPWSKNDQGSICLEIYEGRRKIAF